MTIRSELIKELDVLISMMPVWQRWEKLNLVKFQNEPGPATYAEYIEAHWRCFYNMEKVAFINQLLGETDE